MNYVQSMTSYHLPPKFIPLPPRLMSHPAASASFPASAEFSCEDHAQHHQGQATGEENCTSSIGKVLETGWSNGSGAVDA